MLNQSYLTELNNITLNISLHLGFLAFQHILLCLFYKLYVDTQNSTT